MRNFLVSMGAALTAAALVTIATERQVVTPAHAQAATVAKAAVKGDRLDINRKRVCSIGQPETGAQHNCIRPTVPTKSAPLLRSVFVKLAPDKEAKSWHG